jgi:hypothetical protein
VTRPGGTQQYWIYGAAAALLAAQVAVLHAFGQPFFAASGHLMLWVNDPFSPDMSQQLADWYSFSHIIHGFLFYFAFWLITQRLSLGQRFLAAVTVEAAWEVFENTDFIINRYREATISLDYYGDSIVNSISDILFMVMGFFGAAYLPVWTTVVIALAMELGVGYMIRDNLVLNILMLIYPLNTVREWQAGA